MEEEILEIIGDEIDLLDEFDTDVDFTNRIDDLVNTQNDSISMENYRLELLRILKEAKDMNIPITFDENMSVDELERILASIKM